MEPATPLASETYTVSDAEHALQWLERFENALARGGKLAALFAEESYWRDLLAFTWTIRPHEGRGTIAAALDATRQQVNARQFTLVAGRTPVRRVRRAGTDVIEAIIGFRTDVGPCEGVLRLLASSPGQAWGLMTLLSEIDGYEAAIGQRRPSGTELARCFGGENWSDRRQRERAFDDREPAVLVIGAGQAGLSVAARLRLMGVDALVVDKLPRVGDVWRTRYHALALHNEVVLNHLAHLPFPPNWPKYLPKDMLGNWLETYADAMQCNVWTGTRFVSGRHDAQAGHWHATVRRTDGGERVLRPRHLVFANGVVGAPLKAQAPGLEDFRGEMVHAHDYTEGSRWRGKRVLVLGAGTSGHDIAQDLCCAGAQVTLIQRGSVTVCSMQATDLSHAVYYKEGLPLEDSDLISITNTPTPMTRGYQINTRRMQEIDKELIAALRARGMKLDYGEDGTGYQMKVRSRFGGYYLNCGACELIISGAIGLVQYEDIEGFVADGMRLKDGRHERADFIVAATGYEPPQQVVRQLLGDAIADTVGPIWGLDHDGELANMFRPTPQPGLWFMGGGLAQARIYSRTVALQIKARELGLLPMNTPTLEERHA